jgi:hypothetical protein
MDLGFCQYPEAILGKVRSGFPPGIASEQKTDGSPFPQMVNRLACQR